MNLLKVLLRKRLKLTCFQELLMIIKFRLLNWKITAQFKSKISNLEREIEYKNNELSEKNNIITAKENEVSLFKRIYYS